MVKYSLVMLWFVLEKVQYLEDLFIKQILYIENQIFNFPQLARLSAQVTQVAQ